MSNKKMAFAQQLEQNSKNYYPKDLFDLDAAGDMLTELKNSFGLDTIMTDRHGSIIMVKGDFGDFQPDVVNRPGNKIRVNGRTVCHIYAKYDNVAQENIAAVNRLFGAYMQTIEGFSEKSFLASEQALYIDELEQQAEKEADQAKYSVQTDPLTGLLNRNYFISHMKQLGSGKLFRQQRSV